MDRSEAMVLLADMYDGGLTMKTNFLRWSLVYLIAINGITFLAYGIDKYKAKHNRYRIPEATLLLLAYIGGAYGALFGMRVWHHKTRKRKFQILVPLAIVFCSLILLGAFFFHIPFSFR